MKKIKAPKLTGVLFSQFDNDEPTKLFDIYDYKKITFEYQQTKQKKKSTIIEFYSPNNKKFKLFIKSKDYE